MGLGQFSECGLVNCLLWLRKQINIKSPSINIFNHPVNRPHHPVWLSTESTRLRELCFVISVPAMGLLLCQPARWLEVYQRARGFIQMSWKPRHCATVSDGESSPTRTVLMVRFLFVYDDFDWFLSHVMAYWLCLSPFYC